MYLKIKLLDYHTIIYCKIVSTTKTKWIIKEIPKLNLVNQLTMGTLSSSHDHTLIRFSKIKDYSVFGYKILEVIKKLSHDININSVYD